MKLLFFLALVPFLAACGNSEPISVETGTDPEEKLDRVELGQVSWIRGLSNIQAKASKEKKPVFLLFQEVPG